MVLGIIINPFEKEVRTGPGFLYVSLIVLLECCERVFTGSLKGFEQVFTGVEGWSEVTVDF